jgi:hypothetical protein
MGDGSAVDGLLQEIKQLKEENAKLKRFVSVLADDTIDGAVDALLGVSQGVNDLLNALFTAKHTLTETDMADVMDNAVRHKALKWLEERNSTLIELEGEDEQT